MKDDGEGVSPAKGCANMFLLILVFGALIAGVFGMASAVGPVNELHRQHVSQNAP